MTDLADFGAQMTRIAGEMRRESDDTEAALRSMTKFAVDAIPGAEYATVTLVANGTIETPVMVGDLGGQADNLQRELGEGPCIRAAVSDLTVWIDDMRTETRWPNFAAAAADLGIRSMACFYLYIDGDDSASSRRCSSRSRPSGFALCTDHVSRPSRSTTYDDRRGAPFTGSNTS